MYNRYVQFEGLKFKQPNKKFAKIKIYSEFRDGQGLKLRPESQYNT